MRPNWFIGVPAPLDLELEPPPRVRLLHRDDLHLTVAFLGPCGEARAQAAWEAAAGFDLEVIETTFDRGVLLGDPRRPTAIAALVGSARRRLEEALVAAAPLRAAAGLPPEGRAPLPHVTLARIARRADAAARRRAAQWALGLDLRGVSCRLEELALYTWSEDRATRRYRRVASRPLRAPAGR